MPRQVDIAIFNIARTQVDREEVQRWLDHIGADEFDIPSEEIVTNPALCIALAAKRCYMSFQVGLNPNISKVREDFVQYMDNILASGHGSVLEHSCYTFVIEGVSRVFTAEMNRHRAGWAISEGSLRFIRFDKEIPFWMPTSFQDQPGDDADLAARKKRSREIFHNAFFNQEMHYAELLKVWDMDECSKNFAYKKKITSALRRIVGLGVASGGVWTGNLRALRHVIAMRGDSITAEEEIYHVFCRIAELMMAREPMIFGDFSKNDIGQYRPKNWKV